MNYELFKPLYVLNAQSNKAPEEQKSDWEIIYNGKKERIELKLSLRTATEAYEICKSFNIPVDFKWYKKNPNIYVTRNGTKVYPINYAYYY